MWCRSMGGLAGAMVCLGLTQGCSPGQSEDPASSADAGNSGSTGGELAAEGGGAAAVGGLPGTQAGGAGASAVGSDAASGGAAAGEAGSAGTNSAAGASSGRGGAGGTGSGVGAASGNAAAGAGASGSTCGGVKPASHPVLAAIKKLATSQQEVRILVYGQSISEQSWWSKTKAWLAQTYPQANLIMEEHARGGCAAQCLIGHERWAIDGTQYNRLPEDVFAWKPDLIIFHVYGDHVDYGYIMKAFKQGCDAFEGYRTHDDKSVPQVACTAQQRKLAEGYQAPEVLVQNDFVISDKAVECPAQPTPSNWPCFMNESVIPEQIGTYQYTLQDNFHGWPKYIAEHHLDPSTLIQSDMTHLVEPAGTDVMFQLTIPHLCYAP